MNRFEFWVTFDKGRLYVNDILLNWTPFLKFGRGCEKRLLKEIF